MTEHLLLTFTKFLTLHLWFFSPSTDMSFSCLYVQGALTFVDFVLISRPFKNNDNLGFLNYL